MTAVGLLAVASLVQPSSPPCSPLHSFALLYIPLISFTFLYSPSHSFTLLHIPSRSCPHLLLQIMSVFVETLCPVLQTALWRRGIKRVYPTLPHAAAHMQPFASSFQRPCLCSSLLPTLLIRIALCFSAMSSHINWAKVKRTAVKVIAASQLNPQKQNSEETLDPKATRSRQQGVGQ